MKKIILFAITLLFIFCPSIFASEKLEGIVLDSSGQPASGAQIAVIKPNQYLQFKSGKWMRADQVEADANGRFSISIPSREVSIFFAKDAECLCLPVSEIGEKIVLSKAASVQGIFSRYGKAVEDAEIRVTIAIRGSGHGLAMYEKRVKTDQAGRFKSGEIPCGHVMLSPTNPNSKRTTVERSLQLLPGEKATVDLGGNGMDVIGKLRTEDGQTFKFDQVQLSLKTVVNEPSQKFKTEKERSEWWKAWYDSAEGRAAMNAQRHYSADVSEVGSFKAENILPGKYQVFAYVDAPLFKGYSIREILIEQTDSQVVDIGEIKIKIFTKLLVDEDAPDFTFKTFDDKEHKLSDYKGKWVLIDFWTTSSPAEIPNIKEAYDAFVSNDRTVFISLSLDKEMNVASDYAKENDMRWVQGFLGEWSKTKVPETYGVSGIPAIFLISPDGKIAATDLRGEKIKKVIGERLNKVGMP